MPTLEHNVLVEMFRENPELAPHFLATLFHLEVPLHASVAVVESSLDQLIPVEFRADLVLELRDAKGRLVLAIYLCQYTRRIGRWAGGLRIPALVIPVHDRVHDPLPCSRRLPWFRQEGILLRRERVGRSA